MEQLSRLCLILPADADEIEPTPPDHLPRLDGSPDTCYSQISDPIASFARKMLANIYGSRCFSRFKSSGDKATNKGASDEKFQDMAGVVDWQLQTKDVIKVGGNNPRIFSYAELYIGTRGFSDNELLGSGGFGRVYRAVLPSDGSLAAVKCLAEQGEQFEKTFTAELVAVANLRHRNLVRLRGWCVHEDQLLLVYDYMPNRSLDWALFRRPENVGNEPLDWERRTRITRGLAAALFYLHEQLETQIIHRDVKSSNVMLDSNYNARLGDFGLARWLEHDFEEEEEHAGSQSMRNSYRRFRVADTTRIGGTIGYLPPESFQKRYVATAKSDVFSFGIVVLEIASGRRAVDLTYPDDQIVLLDWIRRLADEGAVLQAGDGRLPDGSHSLAEMELLLHLGLLCTVQDAKSRPNMRWVLSTLSGNILGKLPALPLFKTQPLYISFPSPSNASTTESHELTSTTISSTPTGNGASTIYMTATAKTIYVTAEAEESKTAGSKGNTRSMDRALSLVEMPREISYEEIFTATSGFSEDYRIAEVDFGTAFHGLLEDRRHIMVKRLGIKTCPALRARFSRELHNLGRLRHRNLVQLRGWCTERGEMLVIYDFLPSRLLSHLLFHQWGQTLQWQYRYNIIKSLASAILYLHEEWDEQVVHRNITSNSIVIDHDMNPRLTSFALAEFLTRNEHDHHVVIDKKTSVQGIFGYISPEYMESGEANTAADIYSFGVVMLEIMTGQMAVDFRHPQVLLVKRVHDFEGTERALLELADKQLDGEYDDGQFIRLAKLGFACTASSPNLRPTIRQIVSILDGNDSSFIQRQKEKPEEWKERNVVSLSLIRRIQALGIL
ncbi:hypothetical protein Droror1_Dr00009680 [Drosera rotundifolia]